MFSFDTANKLNIALFSPGINFCICLRTAGTETKTVRYTHMACRCWNRKFVAIKTARRQREHFVICATTRGANLSAADKSSFEEKRARARQRHLLLKTQRRNDSVHLRLGIPARRQFPAIPKGNFGILIIWKRAMA
jgi:hypothetical protein